VALRRHPVLPDAELVAVRHLSEDRIPSPVVAQEGDVLRELRVHVAAEDNLELRPQDSVLLLRPEEATQTGPVVWTLVRPHRM
jgi:hypothetical protein